MAHAIYIDECIQDVLTCMGGRYDSVAACRMLYAIHLQEDPRCARWQYGNGPARGLFQMEEIAVKDVMTRPATKLDAHAYFTDRYCDYLYEPHMVHQALAFDDRLAVVFARLNLWNSPGRLPRAHEEVYGWELYLGCWRPGKPKPLTWTDNWRTAAQRFLG